jgi:hypothetical protein
MIYCIHGADGRLFGAVSAPAELEPTYAAGGYTAFADCELLSIDVRDHYVDLGASPPVIAVREAITLSLDGLVLSGLPNPSTLSVSGPVSGEFVVDDTSATLSFDLPGAYRIKVVPEHPRWRPSEIEVVVP